jgi:hypothetical protein
MSDVERLQRRFDEGTLIDPGNGRTTTVELMRALYRLCGADDVPTDARVRGLEQSLGRFDHYLFVIIDGLGSDVARRFSRGSFFDHHFFRSLQPVFPSTTAAAITSIATATYPAEHGVATWWAYFPDEDVSATILPFVDRLGGESLLLRGVEPESAFPVPSRLPGLSHAAMMITPAQIADSVYSDYCTGGGPRMPHTSPEHAFELAARRIREATGPTFTWIYLPDLDGLAHVHGVHAEPVVRELERYDNLLDGLAAELVGTARIVVTADHGLVDVPADARHHLAADDPLLELLVAPPSGEPTVPIFHVKAGQSERFAAGFRMRFREHFALLATDEVEQLKLLGPDPLSSLTRARLGDYLAIALQPGILSCGIEGCEPPDFRAYHAGLSPAEMSVPLFLA